MKTDSDMGGRSQLDRQKKYPGMHPPGCRVLYSRWDHGLGSKLHDTTGKRPNLLRVDFSGFLKWEWIFGGCSDEGDADMVVGDVVGAHSGVTGWGVGGSAAGGSGSISR